MSFIRISQLSYINYIIFSAEQFWSSEVIPNFWHLCHDFHIGSYYIDVADSYRPRELRDIVHRYSVLLSEACLSFYSWLCFVNVLVHTEK